MEITTPAYDRVLAVPASMKALGDDEGGRYIEGMASTDAIDETQEVVQPGAFEDGIEKFMEHPILSYVHDWMNPIGKIVDWRIEDSGLWIRARLLNEGTNELADRVWNLVEQEVVRALSIGFDAAGSAEDPPGYMDEDNNVWVWERIQLREIAVTPLPANYEATMTAAKSLGLDLTLPLLGAMRTKAVVSYQDLPTADPERDWDAAAARKRIRTWAGGDDTDWEKYRKAFVWYDDEDPERVAAYKLPVADVIDSELKVVWRGVAGAMGALLGARGGADIPEDDEDRVYNHLAKYYEKFEKEPPEKSLHPGDLPDDDPTRTAYEENLLTANITTVRTAALEARNIVRSWRKTGRDLSAAPRDALREAHEALQELTEADPSPQATGDRSGKLLRRPMPHRRTLIQNTN